MLATSVNCMASNMNYCFLKYAVEKEHSELIATGPVAHLACHLKPRGVPVQNVRSGAANVEVWYTMVGHNNDRAKSIDKRASAARLYFVAIVRLTDGTTSPLMDDPDAAMPSATARRLLNHVDTEFVPA